MLQPRHVAIEALLSISGQHDLTLWPYQAQSTREELVNVVPTHLIGDDAGQQIVRRFVRIEVVKLVDDGDIAKASECSAGLFQLIIGKDDHRDLAGGQSQSERLDQ